MYNNVLIVLDTTEALCILGIHWVKSYGLGYSLQNIKLGVKAIMLQLDEAEEVSYCYTTVQASMA